MTKILSATGTLLVALGASMSVLAADAPDAADGQMVARDPVTGQLRAPTHEESQHLGGQRASARAARATGNGRVQEHTLRFHRDGAASVRMHPDAMSHSVLVKRSDGTLQAQCFDSAQAAEAAVQMQASAAKATE